MINIIMPRLISILFKNMFCAGAKGKDSCQGDSGGRCQHSNKFSSDSDPST